MKVYSTYMKKFLFFINIIFISLGCSHIRVNQITNQKIKTIQLNKLTIMHSDSSLFKEMYMYYCVYRGKPIMIYHEKNCSDCPAKFNRFTNNKINIKIQDKYIDNELWLKHYQFSYIKSGGELLINKDVPLYKLLE